MDIRTQYTKKILKESLIKLLEKQKLHEITIKELCGTAGVNKSTLYAHYTDIYALYNDAEEDFLQMILSVSWNNSGARSSKERKEHYINVCNFYKENKQPLLAFYNSGANDNFVAKIGEMMANKIIKNHEPITKSEEMNIRMRFGYSNQGYMYVIYLWLTKYPEIPVDEIADVLITERSNSTKF